MAMFQLLLICVAVFQICDSNLHHVDAEDEILQQVKQYVVDQIKEVRTQVSALQIFYYLVFCNGIGNSTSKIELNLNFDLVLQQ